MTDADHAAIARAFLDARQGAENLSEDRSEGLNLTIEDAYAIQSLVASQLGPVGGFKFARRPGQSAIMAPIQQVDIHPSGWRFSSSGRHVGIELEVGFRFLAAPPPVGRPDFAELLRARVAPVAVIELVRTRLENPDAASEMLKLADHQQNGGLVVGEAARDWDGSPLEAVSARLDIDGTMVLDGIVRLPFGGAFDCLVALARMTGDHCGGLQAGHMVITGSLNGLPWLPPGTKVRGSIGGIGSVAVDIC